MKITDLVRKDSHARFSHFRAGFLYYEVETKDGEAYIFPVDVADLDGATVNASEKSVFMMRYMRKAMKDESLVRAN